MEFNMSKFMSPKEASVLTSENELFRSDYMRIDLPYSNSLYEGSMMHSPLKPRSKKTMLRIEVEGGYGLSHFDVQTLLYLLIKNKLMKNNFSVNHLYNRTYNVNFDLLEDAQYILDEYDGMDFNIIKLNINF